MTVQEFLNCPRGALVKFNESFFKGCVILLDQPKPSNWQNLDAWRLMRYTKFSYGGGRFVNVEHEHDIEAHYHIEELKRARRIA